MRCSSWPECPTDRVSKFAPGRRDKVPLTVRSELSPGATYAIVLPRTDDPLVPTGLVVGLHGGGAGGRDPTLVTGSGESALDFYMDVAEERGVIVVCPTALEAGWGGSSAADVHAAADRADARSCRFGTGVRRDGYPDRVIPIDTSPEAFMVQARCLRRLPMSERLRRALEMCDDLRELCAAGVRRRHPTYGEGQVREEVTRIVLGVAPKHS